MEDAVVICPIDDAQRKRRKEAVIKRLIREKGPKGYSPKDVRRLYWMMYPRNFTYRIKPTAQSLTGAEAGETKNLTSLHICHRRHGRHRCMGKVKNSRGHRILMRTSRVLNFGGIKHDEIAKQPSSPDIHDSEPEIVKHSNSPGSAGCCKVKRPKLSHSSSGTKSEELCKGANNQYYTVDLKDKEL